MQEYSMQKESYIEQLNDNKMLKRILNSFSTITRMNVAVTNTDGDYLLIKRETDFCQLVRSTAQGLNAAEAPMPVPAWKLKNGMNLIF